MPFKDNPNILHLFEGLGKSAFSSKGMLFTCLSYFFSKRQHFGVLLFQCMLLVGTPETVWQAFGKYIVKVGQMPGHMSFPCEKKRLCRLNGCQLLQSSWRHVSIPLCGICVFWQVTCVFVFFIFVDGPDI